MDNFDALNFHLLLLLVALSCSQLYSEISYLQRNGSDQLQTVVEFPFPNFSVDLVVILKKEMDAEAFSY